MKRYAGKIKRFLFPVLCLVLLCFMPVNAGAAGGGIELSDAGGAWDDEVRLNVRLSGCGAGNTMGISLQYDKTALELRTGDCKWLKDGLLQNFDRGKDIGVWACETAQDLNGDVCTLVFRIRPDAPAVDTDINCSLLVKDDSDEIGNYSAKYTLARGHSHSFGDFVRKDEDKHVRTCSECGFEEVLSHDWDNGRIAKEPTDTEEGEVSYTCKVCGAVRIDRLAAKGKPGGAQTEGQPSQGSPGQTTPAQGSQSQTTPVHGTPAHTTPTQGSQSHTTPAQGSQSQTTSAQGSQSQTTSAQGSQSQTTPAQGTQSQTTSAQGIQSQGTVQGSAPSYGSQGQSPQQGGSQPGEVPVVDVVRLENQARDEENLRGQGHSQTGESQPGSQISTETAETENFHIHEDGTIHVIGAEDDAAHADGEAGSSADGLLLADGSVQSGGSQQGALSSAGALAGEMSGDRREKGILWVWIATVGILAAVGIMICCRGRIKQLSTINKKEKGKEK